MRSLKFLCVVTSSMTSFVDLQGHAVPLGQTGNGWSGSLSVVLDTTLAIAVRVTGVVDSAWTVAITTDCPGAEAAKILTCSGTIPPGGSQNFATSVTIAPDPCNPKAGAGADKTGCPPTNTALMAPAVSVNKAAKKIASKNK